MINTVSACHNITHHTWNKTSTIIQEVVTGHGGISAEEGGACNSGTLYGADAHRAVSVEIGSTHLHHRTRDPSGHW